MPERHTLLMVIDGHRHRDAGLHRGLARGHLARAGLEHLAHDHVVDLLGADAAARERGLDRVRRRGPWPRSDASAPESLPMGVRADETMTEPGMADLPTADCGR